MIVVIWVDVRCYVIEVLICISVLVSWTGITKYHSLGGLKNKFISQSSGGWKSKKRVPAGLICGEASLPALQMSTFSRCPHRAFPLCIHGERKVSDVSSRFYKDISSTEIGPLLYHVNLRYLSKGLISKCSHIGS